MQDFKGRVAVITGAAGGIGGALARALAARGARLALADLDEAGMDLLAKDLEATGTEVISVHTDVRSEESVEALAREVESRLGGVHIVCNNAGIATAGELASVPAEEWKRAMDVNFWGVVNGVRSFVPRLIARDEGGHVLNTASMAGLTGMQFMGVYSASKFAVVGLSEALVRELAPHGIGVHVLCPMMVDTNMTRGALGPGPAEGGPASSLVGRIIPAEEVAERALAGMLRGEFYILTHPEQGEILRRRAARIERAFEAVTRGERAPDV